MGLRQNKQCLCVVIVRAGNEGTCYNQTVQLICVKKFLDDNSVFDSTDNTCLEDEFIVDFSLFMRFVNNNKNIEHQQIFEELKAVKTMVVCN